MAKTGNRRGTGRLDRALAALAGGCLRLHLALLRKSDVRRAIRRQAVLERRAAAQGELLSELFERGYEDGAEGRRPALSAGRGALRSAYGLGYVAGELTALAEGCEGGAGRRRSS